MTEATANTLDESARLQRNAASFRALTDRLRQSCRRRDYATAAVLGEICALFGSYSHHGSLFSEPLEELLATIGRATIETGRPRAHQQGEARTIKRVLHVLTAAKPVGGDSRFVWRWIERDAQRQHSVALTRQVTFEVPAEMREAVSQRGGRVFVLDERNDDAIARARALRRLSWDYDAVFIHTYVEDIVPALAFFAGPDLPPIVFVMQADHQLFVGLGASDGAIHMRESGLQLAVQRRGQEATRSACLPIPLDPLVRRNSRAQARQQLGLPQDAVVLLSIARAVKYTPVVAPAFTDVAVKILEANSNAVMVVVGPSDTGAWREGAERTGGRLRAVGQQNQVSLYYEAADIYLDSFPFASNTSLLEAGSYGLPLVSFCPFPECADVLAAGTPGLDRVLLKTRSMSQYLDTIAELIRNPVHRTEVGERTRESIHSFHGGERWHQCLAETIDRVATLPPRSRSTQPPERYDELDHLLGMLYRNEAPLGVAITRFARNLDYRARVRLLLSLLPVDRTFSFEMFLPRGLARVAGPWFHGWRRLPFVRMLLRPSLRRGS